jgi:pyrroloquinoline quinone biosynthesis protein B
LAFRALVLGAAAGGGLPQWNCGCTNCCNARKGLIPPQTQSSLAVTGDGKSWALLNASPDIRQQLLSATALHPTGPRDVPVASVLLTNGDIDHVAGLLTLRERQAFTLYATAGIHDILSQNPIFGGLDPALVTRSTVAMGAPVELVPGLVATLFPVPGKVPLYLEDGSVDTRMIGDQTVGVRLDSGGTTAFYIPGCAALTPEISAMLDGAAILFFDGTLWHDDEMIRAGLGTKTGRRMGHMPIAGPGGSIASFAGLRVGRKILVHMNNTNPVLDPRSPQRAEAEAAGWIVGSDGMEITP